VKPFILAEDPSADALGTFVIALEALVATELESIQRKAVEKKNPSHCQISKNKAFEETDTVVGRTIWGLEESAR
jgi:hypothetical protein